MLAAPADAPALLAVLDINVSASTATPTVIKLSSSASVDTDYISVPEHISYPTKNGLEAYALYYPPLNKRHVGKEGELPPLVVRCHGGPTSSAKEGLDWNIQFFTSRGFALVGESLSFSLHLGTIAYPSVLGQTSITVAHRATVGTTETVSPASGGSSTLRTLSPAQSISSPPAKLTRIESPSLEARRVDTPSSLLFAQGMCSEPERVTMAFRTSRCWRMIHTRCVEISMDATGEMGADLFLQFESNYLFALLGGTPQEVPENYRGLFFLRTFVLLAFADPHLISDRSPLHNSASITAPLLLLQGSIDRVVPQEQAIAMSDKIKGAGGQCEMIIFDGEGHGWRRADTKKRAMEEELSFVRRTFGIEGGKE